MVCPDSNRVGSVGGNAVPGVDVAVCALPTITDARGSLTFCEFSEHVPFVPQRLFWVHGVPEAASRGGHAHKRCEQLFVCLKGSLRLAVDNGIERTAFVLDDPAAGFYVPAGLWTDLSEFQPGTVLLVLASHPYDASDYLRDHAEFVDWIAARG